MSHREKHVYDIATENKLRKADANAKRKAEDESLAHHVRRHELYELCGGDMLRFRMMLDVLSDRGLIDEAIIDEADARAHRHAAGYPVNAPVKKIESLRAELWREPDPVLAALLERDAFVCVSGAGCSPMVYYGSGCLTDYKARILSPDAVAPCPMAGAGARGRQLGPATPGAPGTTSPPIGAPSKPLSSPSPARETVSGGGRTPIRVDKMVGTPELAEWLVAIVGAHQPLDQAAVIARLCEEAGRSRFEETTVTKIGADLGKLIGDGRVHLTASGYRLPTASDWTGSMGEAVGQTDSIRARSNGEDANGNCMAGSRSIGSQAGISDPATTSNGVAGLPGPGSGADTPLPGAEHAGGEMPLEA